MLRDPRFLGLHVSPSGSSSRLYTPFSVCLEALWEVRLGESPVPRVVKVNSIIVGPWGLLLTYIFNEVGSLSWLHATTG